MLKRAFTVHLRHITSQRSPELGYAGRHLRNWRSICHPKIFPNVTSSTPKALCVLKAKRDICQSQTERQGASICSHIGECGWSTIIEGLALRPRRQNKMYSQERVLEIMVHTFQGPLAADQANKTKPKQVQ